MFGFFLLFVSFFGFCTAFSVICDSADRYRRRRIIYIIKDKEVKKLPTIVEAEVVKELDKN